VTVSIYSIFDAASPYDEKIIRAKSSFWGGEVEGRGSLTGSCLFARPVIDVLFHMCLLKLVETLKHFTFNLIEWVVEALGEHGSIIIPLIVEAKFEACA